MSFPLGELPYWEHLRFFDIIAGEVDEFPLGEVRKDWAADALAAADRQFAEYEARMFDQITVACSSLTEALLPELA